MKVLVSTELVLDVLLDRQPDVVEAARIMSMVEAGDVSAYLTDSTVTIVHSVASRLVGRERANKEVHKLLLIFDIAPVSRVVLEGALLARDSDLEDAILSEAARHVGADALVTRRPDVYRDSQVAVYTPERFLKAVSQRGRAHADHWD
jgi:predicted nucleic acid-binding protein